MRLTPTVQTRVTALLHHLDVAALERAFRRQRRQAGARVDGITVAKADGGQRPLGVPTVADKIVQGAVAELLSAICEVDFLGFSHGFRPGRNPHQGLAALHTAIMSQRVNWVLDADIRSFFKSVGSLEIPLTSGRSM